METESAPGESARRIATATHCPYCALQCGMHLEEAGNVLEVRERAFSTNRGAMCRKGWTSAELIASPDRLKRPLARAEKGAPLEETTWDEAIARVAAEFGHIQREHGPDAVGVFGGGGLTNETAYMLGKFARVVLRTRTIDYNGRFCMASAAVAAEKAFGVDRGLPFPIEHLPEAEVVVLVGANPAETMPPLMQYFDAQRARGGQLVVVDPRRTATAERATLHLAPAPGTDVALANGLLHVAIRDGLVDRAFVDARTTGFEAAAHVASSYWPDRVERITGVTARALEGAAHLLAKARTAFVLSARGAEQHSQGVQALLAFVNLTLALGKAGKPYCGFGSITGQGNGQGGREHGQKCDQLPGYRKLSDPGHRAHMAAFWGVAEADLPLPGPAGSELLLQLASAGGARGLLVMGSNLVVSSPDAGRLEERLARLDFLVVADPFLSETAALADVVLPVCQWAEHEGTMTNLEGRVLHRRPARPPPIGVWTDLQILAAASAALGRPGLIEASPELAFDELRRASAGGLADYSGITYARLRSGEPLYWPCPGDGHPGTPTLFLDRFATPDGKARFHPTPYAAAVEGPDEEYPLYLTTGRVLAHYQTGTQTRRVPSLAQAEPEPFVELHPALAATFQIAEGDRVAVRTRRGRIVVKARLVSTMRLDTLFVPFHWSGPGRVNTLTSTAVDPSSKIPEFKLSAAAIQKLPPLPITPSRFQ